MKIVDINNNKVKGIEVKDSEIVSGTEQAYKTQKGYKKFVSKIQEHKEEWCKNNTVKSMCYDNGSALALLYKEVQKLNSLLITKLNSDEQKQKESQE